METHQTATKSVLQFRDAGKRFCTPARPDLWAVRDLSLDCPAGKITCIVGPSGCGKTTLLRLAAGLDDATTGQVVLNGATVSGPSQGVGLVSQEGGLLPWMSVEQNVALGLSIAGRSRADRRARAARALGRVHLPPEVSKSFPHELSGGMRRRAALARVLCSEAPVLLMDEPFGGLDEHTRRKLQTQLVELWTEDRPTILFITHSIEEAVMLADRVVVMGFATKTAEIEIDLTHPRDPLSPDSLDCQLKIRELLQQTRQPQSL
ncbi:MAG: ABC transporter ATP-binding protein [Phycisphaerales bacterium]|jgi:NitT/TauT family transport system ATP-binding protein|nr:ABC transporter ATP-binding protein [Phycisphaerales bacterium]